MKSQLTQYSLSVIIINESVIVNFGQLQAINGLSVLFNDHFKTSGFQVNDPVSHC